MAIVHETTAILRFFGPDLDPEEITNLLGAYPSSSTRKGESRVSSSGIERFAKTGSWLLSVPNQEPGNLDIQINELLQTTTTDMAVWRELTARFEADIFCGIFMSTGNEGIDLPANTIAELGCRNLSLEFDIYDPSDD